MADGSIVNWALRHGVVSLVLRRAARRGELQARLMVEQQARHNPYPMYEQIRERGPLYQGELTWMAAQHRAAQVVLRSENFRVGINEEATPWYLRRFMFRPPDRMVFDPVDPPSLLAVNPPQHTTYRKLVSKVFTPRAIAAIEPQIQRQCRELLDAQPDQGVVDLVRGYVSKVPVTVISTILGVPLDMQSQLLTWGHRGAAAFDVGLTLREYRQTERALVDVSEWLLDHISQLRRNPGPDMLSQLITAEVDGVRLSEKEVLYTSALVLAAGFETTVNLLGNGINLLLAHPEQLQQLLAEPQLWPNAIEEILRIEAPIQAVARVSERDQVVHGVEVPKDAFVAVMIGAANRDPAVFEDPDRFDITRRNARDHLSFSAGVHFCLGANLARLEGRIALQTLFERYPQMAAAGPVRLRPTRTLRGIEALPVRMGPRVQAEPLVTQPA